MSDRADPRVERTHAEVHAAVLALLEEEGLEGVRHGRVAERSGVSRATVYRHWPDRAALLVSTLQAMRPQLELPGPSGDLRTDVRTLVGTIAEHLNDNQMLADMLVLLRQADEDPDFAVVRQHVVPLEGNPAVAMLEAARAAGDVRADVPVEVQVGMLFGPMLAIRVLLRERITDVHVDAVVDMWLEGARAD